MLTHIAHRELFFRSAPSLCPCVCLSVPLQAIDHIINSGAKQLYMSAGDINVPIVFRGTNGAAAGVAAQHSQDFAAWYSSVPGLKVVSPWNCDDARGMMKAAIRDNNPVVRHATCIMRHAPAAACLMHSLCAMLNNTHVLGSCVNYCSSTSSPTVLSAVLSLVCVVSPRDFPFFSRRPAPLSLQVVLENELLYGQSFKLSAEAQSSDFLIPFGKLKVERPGTDVTITAFSRMVGAALEAADKLAAEHGISAEVLNLRSLRPLDRDGIIASVRKTSRLVSVEEGWPQCGIGAELGAICYEECFDALDAPVERVTGVDVPMPYAINLEKAALPHVHHIVNAALKACYRKK